MRRLAAALAGTALLVSGAVLLLVSRQKKETVPEVVLTYAENQTQDYPTTEGAYYFADLVKERTAGRVEVLVYPNAQLGDEVSTVQQLSWDGIDMVRCSLYTLEDYNPETIVLMLPYLYESSGSMWKVLDGEIGQEIMDSFSDTGMVALSWYDAGVRSFYFREPVSGMEDLAGKLIRVQQSGIMEDMVRALGATPVPMNYEDVYAGLQQGSVDGAENNWNSYAAMEHYQVAPYFWEDEHIRIPELQLISRTALAELSEKDQETLRACAAESAQYERKRWQEQEQQAKQQAAVGGCTVVPISDSDRQKMKEAMAPLYETYGSEYQDLIRRIQAAQE
ncbi:MAG: TRAP transporter substrate-binding protein [Lachnospiraceae bacterium]